MAMSGRVTRRTSTASQRFHASSRSRPVFALIGGIGVCFAAVIGFVLLGGSPAVDDLPERIAQLEEKAARLASEEKLEESIKVYEELLSIAVGDRWKVKILEWRAAIKEHKAHSVRLQEAKGRIAAWEKAAAAATPANARSLWEEGCRLREAYPRLWKHDAILNKLPPHPEGPPGWQKMNRKIIETHKLEKRGEAHWSRALKDWKEYQAIDKLPAADRDGAEGCVKTLELKARDEVRTLVNKAATPEDREALKLHRPRFDGTGAAAELEKAIAGR